LLVFLLGIGNTRSRRISSFPNKGIEQMARKNDGASANPTTSCLLINQSSHPAED
jgi:hypothetical protein